MQIPVLVANKEEATFRLFLSTIVYACACVCVRQMTKFT